MAASRANQRFILFWTVVVIGAAMALLYAFTVVDQRDATASREAAINATIAAMKAKADPAPVFVPGHYYP